MPPASCVWDAAVVMRIFETYPPSSLMLAVAVAVVWAIGGLSLALPCLVGGAVMALGRYIDLYGIRRRR